MCVMGAQAFHFHSITTDNQLDMLHCDCATVMILAISKPSLNMPCDWPPDRNCLGEDDKKYVRCGNIQMTR